jgi:cation:H+ antiporter
MGNRIPLRWYDLIRFPQNIFVQIRIYDVTYMRSYRIGKSLNDSSIVAVVGGLVMLVWSADRFIEGSAAVARYAGMPPLLIGMVIVGFGTSAPEMVVSAIAAFQGNPGLAMGNAYGSNITNIALILGLTALISPIAVSSRVLVKELPILFVITLIAGFQLIDGEVTRTDGWILLSIFGALMAWTIAQGLRMRSDNLNAEMENKLKEYTISLKWALFWLLGGIILLVVSSRILVWGAVEIARGLNISDLVIGLTVVALGTSLPELASSLMAIRRKEHDIAVGNVIGSNLFNTLAVVGIAGVINPIKISPDILSRDFFFMIILTFSLFAIGYGFRGPGRINRYEGAILTASIWRIYGVADCLLLTCGNLRSWNFHNHKLISA